MLGPCSRLGRLAKLQERWRPGRPETTWRRMVEDERRVAGWQSWKTVRALAANRSGWKENVKALCALRHEEM